MVFEGLTGKEKASVLLGAILRKLPPTRSGRGFFVTRVDRYKFVWIIADSLARVLYSEPFYSLDSVKDSSVKENLWLEQAGFRIIVETILFEKLILLPKVATSHNYFRNIDAVNAFVELVIYELDYCGMFGNMKLIKESPMTAMRHLAKALLRVSVHSKWLEYR